MKLSADDARRELMERRMRQRLTRKGWSSKTTEIYKKKIKGTVRRIEGPEMLAPS